MEFSLQAALSSSRPKPETPNERGGTSAMNRFARVVAFLLLAVTTDAVRAQKAPPDRDAGKVVIYRAEYLRAHDRSGRLCDRMGPGRRPVGGVAEEFPPRHRRNGRSVWALGIRQRPPGAALAALRRCKEKPAPYSSGSAPPY